MHGTLNADDRLLPSRHVRAIITPRGGALLDLRTRRGRWLTLTSTAAFWWTRIQNGCTVGEARQAVADEYGLLPRQATADLAPFEADMVRRRLLIPAKRHSTSRWQR